MGATIDEIIDSLKRGQGKRVSDLVKMALEEGTDPQMILEDGFLAGMEQVADKFRKEEVGVPEILSVTRALERGVSTLRHYSGGRAKKEIGTVIIGTVKGDLHDIGKNLVKIMMESKNIRVIDLGVDVSPRRFLEEAVGSHAQIVCLSGIMPHSEEDMRAVVEEFEMKGIRDQFLYGACGLNLDILARGPLWDMGIDYKCGTGHGVGYILNVHEGPNGFRWKIVPERHDSGVLEEGMITTDEPGVYLEGKYGIRTENELVCRKAEKNEYGQFMEFENITYAPIDLDGIDPEQMSPREKQMLNDYHKKVYEVLSPYMTEEENEWLKKYTRAI